MNPFLPFEMEFENNLNNEVVKGYSKSFLEDPDYFHYDK